MQNRVRTDQAHVPNGETLIYVFERQGGISSPKPLSSSKTADNFRMDAEPPRDQRGLQTRAISRGRELDVTGRMKSTDLKPAASIDGRKDVVAPQAHPLSDQTRKEWAWLVPEDLRIERGHDRRRVRNDARIDSNPDLAWCGNLFSDCERERAGGVADGDHVHDIPAGLGSQQSYEEEREDALASSSTFFRFKTL